MLDYALNQTLTTDFMDQEKAGEISQLNEHQQEPVYNGGWTPDTGLGEYGQEYDPDYQQEPVYTEREAPRSWKPM